MDPESFRVDSRERWERSAAGWAAQADDFQRWALPVSRWLVDAARPQPGQTLLELAAGPGDTGLLAAPLVAPGGKLICSDQAEAMLDAARERAARLGLDNVELARLELEWIDLEAASVDAVLCRWGYMLVPDPEAALRETRRVLRPGGRVALAVWDAAERNPWAGPAGGELVERGLIPAPAPGAPGMFALADPARLRRLLEAAGFAEIEIEGLDLVQSHPDFEHWWRSTLDLSIMLAEAVAGLAGAERDDLRDAMHARLAAFERSDGRIAIPGRTHVAAATA